MIQFNDVHKIYSGGRNALRQISLYIEPGELVFVTGRSGAGKSTLLRLIALIERHTRGQIIIDGQNLERITSAKVPYFRRKVSCIFQDHRLLYDRPIFDNVALPLVIAGYRRPEILRRVRAALDQVGLLKNERHYPITLSSGEQQRVGIARAVVNRPRILLADEPTGNLDPGLSREIMTLFERFQQVGVTVVLASHDLDLIQHFSYRELTLSDGSLLEDGVGGTD